MKKEKFLHEANEAIALLDKAIISGDTPKGVDTNELKVFKENIERMLNEVTEDRLPPQESRYATLTRKIIDEWEWGSDLGSKISSIEELYQDL